MKVDILKRAILEGIPSASGVEIFNGIIYIIGDDSKTLFSLNHNLQIIQQMDLFEAKEASHERIKKKDKPDFECLTHIQIHGYDYLLVNGSGSKENRDGAYLVKMPTKFNKNFFAQKKDFQPLYDLFRSNDEIVGDGKLNIEGAAYSESIFVYLNRGNKKGNNAALVFNTEEMQVFLGENSDMLPFPKVIPYDLPQIGGLPSGFSGACIIDNKLLFTASAEDTEDAILDGDVAGSLIGWMAINPEGMLKSVEQPVLSEIKDYFIITENNLPYLGKIESLSIFEKDSDDKYIAIAVTDSDDGKSEILMLEINFQ